MGAVVRLTDGCLGRCVFGSAGDGEGAHGRYLYVVHERASSQYPRGYLSREGPKEHVCHCSARVSGGGGVSCGVAAAATPPLRDGDQVIGVNALMLTLVFDFAFAARGDGVLFASPSAAATMVSTMSPMRTLVDTRGGVRKRVTYPRGEVVVHANPQAVFGFERILLDIGYDLRTSIVASAGESVEQYLCVGYEVATDLRWQRT